MLNVEFELVNGRKSRISHNPKLRVNIWHSHGSAPVLNREQRDATGAGRGSRGFCEGPS